MNRSIERALAALAAIALVATPLAAMDISSADVQYSRLLVRYTTPGGVRYASWRSNGEDFKKLSQVVTSYRAASTKDLSGAEREAYYINSYNARVVEMILQGNPPRSIKNLSRMLKPMEIFSRAVVVIDGKPTSLKTLAKKLIEETKDPRVYFALNCATRTSARLRDEAYDAVRLDTQLDDATRSYLATQGTVDLTTAKGETTITTVDIFKRYADDFKAAGGTLRFLADYGPAEAADAIKLRPGKVKLEFRKYDWSLNAAH